MLVQTLFPAKTSLECVASKTKKSNTTCQQGFPIDRIYSLRHQHDSENRLFANQSSFAGTSRASFFDAPQLFFSERIVGISDECPETRIAHSSSKVGYQ